MIWYIKKIQKLLTLIVIFSVFCGSFHIIVKARELEICGLCGGNGDYYCETCKDTGEVVCDGCGGAGGSKCIGDTYKGNPCDNGYYVCPSCDGDGLSRPIPADGNPGPCGNCGGAGILRCISCSNGEPGWHSCEGCEGDGIKECYVGTCEVSRQYNGNCPKCKGTGYILVGNPMPPLESNDGIANVPAEGDYIVTNDKTWEGYVYGGGDVDADTSNVIESVAENSPHENNTPENNTPETNLVDDSDTLSSVSAVPDNRNENYEIPLSAEEKSLASAVIEIEAMSAEEQMYYASLSDEELNQKLTNVQQILGSVQPRRFEDGTEELVRDIAKQNGYSTLEEGGILPIYFQGHEDLGFPIAVDVHIEQGVLNGGSVQTIRFYTTGFSSFFTSEKELDIAMPVMSDTGELSVETGNNPENAEREAESYFPWGVVVFAFVIAIIIYVVIDVKRNKKSNPVQKAIKQT